MVYTVEIALLVYGIVHLTTIMDTGTGVQVILRFCSDISETVMLVLLKTGFHKLHRRDDLGARYT
jgi:hypothetical protein